MQANVLFMLVNLGLAVFIGLAYLLWGLSKENEALKKEAREKGEALSYLAHPRARRCLIWILLLGFAMGLSLIVITMASTYYLEIR